MLHCNITRETPIDQLVPGVRRANAARLPPLSLALQGGGSFGAFTWGVLDRLLEEPSFRLDTVSGASAGAVNAVLLAAGLAEAQDETCCEPWGETARAAARGKLARFWQGVSQAGSAPFLNLMLHVSAAIAGPGNLNPLNLNPLREMLGAEVDFARLRAARPVRLLIAATRVRDGGLALFREDAITLDMVLASACLPQINAPIEVDGEAYWDGGFAANPPLSELVRQSATPDVLLIRLLPEDFVSAPHGSADIARRLNEIAFAAPLKRERAALEDLRAACKGAAGLASALCRRLSRLRLHEIAAEDSLPGLAAASAMDTSPAFIARLFAAGRNAAETWIAR